MEKVEVIMWIKCRQKLKDKQIKFRSKLEKDKNQNEDEIEMKI